MKAIAIILLLVCLSTIGDARYSRHRYCTPDKREPCNDEEPTTEVTSYPVSRGFGPFVCKYKEVVTTYAYDYVWEGRDCRTYFRYYTYCSSYECVRSTECHDYRHLNKYYDCCPGYSIDTNATRDSTEYQNELREGGCPPERQELETCLSDLGLDAINGIIRASSTFDDSMPFTLFAPTNQAIKNAGVSDEDSEGFLLSHVVSGMVYGNRLSDGQQLPGVVSETFVHITTVGDERIFASGAQIVQTDACFAENGVVHVINGTIATDARSVTEVIAATDTLSIFNRLLDAANILDGEKVYTVFAPTDAAFEALARETQLNIVDCLLSSSTSAKTLKHYLFYHVTTGAEYSSTLSLRDTIDTKSCHTHRRHRSWCFYGRCGHSRCQSLTIQMGDESLSVGSSATDLSAIETADIPASNGVIHTISSPLSNPSIDLDEVCADFSV